ncbi:MAG: GNAT family N-acetyltransferase [Thermoplasmata archaeon]
MIRDFRPTQATRLFDLLVANFPVEERLYGMRPESWGRIVRRIYRWDTRLILGLFRMVRRPIFRFFTIEADGRLAATTILSFSERAGYVSMVMVDSPYRRRGYARRLLERSHEVARAAGKRYVALDVFEENAPAIALYRGMGYETLRESGLFARSLDPAASPPTARAPSGYRRFRSSDRDPLFALALEATPARVAEVLPPRRAAIGGSDLVDRILSGESMSFVLDGPTAPIAWVAVSVSDTMEAAVLSTPLVGPSVPAETAADLVREAIDWAGRHGAVRVVAQTPLENRRAVAALEGAGLTLAHRLYTLYCSVR